MRWERSFQQHKVIWVTFSKCLQDNYWCIINYMSNHNLHEKFHLHLTITASCMVWSGRRSSWVPATGPEQRSRDRSAEIVIIIGWLVATSFFGRSLAELYPTIYWVCFEGPCYFLAEFLATLHMLERHGSAPGTSALHLMCFLRLKCSWETIFF